MKTLLTSLLLCYTILSASAQDTWTDTRDNQTYKTVTLDGQTWLAQNFNFEIKGSFCYDNEEENCEKHGRLYTWEAAAASVPEGWHVPTVAEWEALMELHGGVKSTEFSMHYYPNADEVGPKMFKALGASSNFAGLRLGEERKATNDRIPADLVFASIDEQFGYWANSDGLDKYDKTCPADAQNNCAVLSVRNSYRFHWEICDDFFRTDAISLRLVKDE